MSGPAEDPTSSRSVMLVVDGVPCRLDYRPGLASEMAGAIGAGPRDVQVTNVRDQPDRSGAVITFEVFAPYYVEVDEEIRRGR